MLSELVGTEMVSGELRGTAYLCYSGLCLGAFEGSKESYDDDLLEISSCQGPGPPESVVANVSLWARTADGCLKANEHKASGSLRAASFLKFTVT